MIKFFYQFPVYDRKSGINVFDWIMQKSQEVRKDRKLVREMQYRQLIASKDPDGKLSKETSQKAGKAEATTAKAAPASA